MVIKIFLLGVSLFIATLILHRGVQWLHPYVLMQAVVELRSMFTVRDVPLENIRDKRIFVLVDPNVERATPALGSLRGKGARLVVATHLPDPPCGSIERLSLEFAQEISRVLGLRCALPGPSRPHPVCSEQMTGKLPSIAASDATRIGLSMFGRVCESSSERAVPRLQTLGTRTDTALLPVG
jgi:hypothetical protein